MTDKKLFIIIPVFNGWNQTRICMERLYAGTLTDSEIIVVDHGTDDDTKNGLKADYPEVTRIKGNEDMWWTAATNLGIRFALEQGADTVMLLNNDCYVERNTLSALAMHTTENRNAIVAPLQRSSRTGKIATHRVTSGFVLGFPTVTLPGSVKYTPGKPHLLKTGLIVGGRGATIPADIFRQAGLFNEDDLPHYGADHDFYLRCKKLGINLFIASDAIVEIDDSHTTIANNIGNLSLKEFIETLRSRRSHRNIREIAALFRLHYPIPGLYLIGVFLNLLRYVIFYSISRLKRLLGLC